MHHIAEDGRLARRQIGEPSRVSELGDQTLGLKVGQRFVDGGEQGRIVGEADITTIGTDRVIVSGWLELVFGMSGSIGVEPRLQRSTAGAPI